MAGGIDHMSFLPDGKKLALLDKSGRSHLLDVMTGAVLDPSWDAFTAPKAARSEPVTRALAGAPRQPSAMSPGEAWLWDLAAQELVCRYTHGPFRFTFVISPDARLGASFDVQHAPDDPPATRRTNWAVNVWHIPEATNRFPTFWQSQPVEWVAFSPDSRMLAVACGDRRHNTPGEVKLYSLVTGKLIHTPWTLESCVRHLAFSPDGAKLAVGCGDTQETARHARLLDLSSGRFVGQPMPHREAVSFLAFSPDGRWLLSASGGIARVWDARDGRPVPREMPAGGRGVGSHAAGFSPDSRRVFTASGDGFVRWWDALTGEPITPIWRQGPSAYLTQLDASGVVLAVGCQKLGGCLWHLSPTALSVADLKEFAELSAGRRLDRYGGLEPILAGELQTLWRTMRARHPLLFAPAAKK
jgi:hypothetical protein